MSAVVLDGIAEGAIGVAMTSGSPITLTIDRLKSDRLELAPSSSASGEPALLVRLPSAELSGLCQAMTTGLPVVGDVTVVLRAEQVRATDLVLEAHTIAGGLDLRELSLGSSPVTGEAGYRAGPISLSGVTITAGAVTAGTFTISGLNLGHRTGAEGCSSSGEHR